MRQTAGDRTIGIVYAAYFAVAIASVGVARWPAISESLALLSTFIYGWLTVLFFRLFSRVNRPVATALLSVGIAGCGVQAYGTITHVAWEQRLALAFFGAFCLALAYLIASSSYIPKVFAALLFAAGIGWLCFAVPTLAAPLRIAAELVGFVAELALMLWLLVRGVTYPSRR